MVLRDGAKLRLPAVRRLAPFVASKHSLEDYQSLEDFCLRIPNTQEIRIKTPKDTTKPFLPVRS